MRATLYTIGYQRRTPDELVADLHANGVTLLIDVRDVPWSRKRGFSRSKLAEAITGAGIAYEHRRDLGSPKPVREVWKQDLDRGRAMFADLAKRERGDAIAALVATAKAGGVALLCLEEDPHQCHRSIVAAMAATRGKLKVVDL